MNRSAINVTPLIDVLLVLLIIFMIITPIRPSSIETSIPNEPRRNVPVQINPLTLVVTVGEDMSLRINQIDRSASVDEPEPVILSLKEIFALRRKNFENEKTVFVKAPRTIDYGSVAKVVDAVKAAGADPVSLQIDELDPKL
jgi:biopolymer transport protein ExbD